MGVAGWTNLAAADRSPRLPGAKKGGWCLICGPKPGGKKKSAQVLRLALLEVAGRPQVTPERSSRPLPPSGPQQPVKRLATTTPSRSCC